MCDLKGVLFNQLCQRKIIKYYLYKKPSAFILYLKSEDGINLTNHESISFVTREVLPLFQERIIELFLAHLLTWRRWDL